MLAQTEPTPNDKGAPGELVRRIASGDLQAETLLVEKFSRGLLFVLRRRLGDEARVQDIYQDTFALVIQKARNGQIREPQYVASFIRSTGLNLAMGETRKDIRRQTYTNHDAVVCATDPGRCAYCELEREQKSQIVRDLLEELRMPRDREVLARFYLADEDKEDICQDLDLTAAHFDRVLHRARRRFRAIAQDLFGAGGFDDSSLGGQT